MLQSSDHDSLQSAAEREHFYIVSEPIKGLSQLPVLRVPDECAYYKEDAGKMMLGAFEPQAKPWAMNGIPDSFEFDQLPEDFDHFEPILEMAINRMPMLGEAGIHTFFNGPESFTPDDAYHLGLLWGEIAKPGVKALICDSTNVFSLAPGRSEATLGDNITQLVASADQLVVATTFASNVARVKTLAEAARRAGRSVCLMGRAMNKMVEAALETGVLSDFPPVQV